MDAKREWYKTKEGIYLPKAFILPKGKPLLLGVSQEEVKKYASNSK